MNTQRARQHIERARETLATSEAVKERKVPPDLRGHPKKEIFTEALARAKEASAWETTHQ